MSQHFRRRQSLVGIPVQESFQQTPCILRDVILQSELPFHDQRMQVIHVQSFEGHSPIEHCVQHNSHTPHVSLVPIIAIVPQDLRSNVGRSATLFIHLVKSTGHYP